MYSPVEQFSGVATMGLPFTTKTQASYSTNEVQMGSILCYVPYCEL